MTKKIKKKNQNFLPKFRSRFQEVLRKVLLEKAFAINSIFSAVGHILTRFPILFLLGVIIYFDTKLTVTQMWTAHIKENSVQ